MKIGIDMGGTNLRAALVDENGIIRKNTAPCPSQTPDPEDVLKVLERLVSEIITPEVDSIGVGVPSVVDVEKGIVYNVANIPSWKEVHLKDWLEERFPGRTVKVNNDANCFALGEAKYGAGKGYPDVVGLTLGTGTGAGIIVDGKLYNGSNIGAGEIGYIPFKDSIYEDYCSGAFFKNMGLDGCECAKKAEAGDKEMQELWKEFGRNIASLIKTVAFAYDPEVIVIGGGIAASSALYENEIRAGIADFPYPKTIEKLIINFTTNPDVALTGAASL